MAHTHDVYDMENHFEINGSSRFIKETSETKLVVVQGDHKSEVLTFKMPRYIDGHDMTLCNKIRIHYINLDPKTNNKSADVYEVTDLTLCEEREDVLTFTWTIEAPATKYFGTLSFLVKFECTEGENVLYQWNTAKYVSVNVLAGIDNSEEFVEKYSNVLDEWYAELTHGADSILELTDQSLAEIEASKQTAFTEFSADVDAKAEETLETIPSNYKKLYDQVEKQQDEIDSLNQGGLVLKEDFIGNQVEQWLNKHPEATTTVQNKSLTLNKFVDAQLPFVRVEQFGAVGDGVIDDTESIQNCINYASQNGLSAHFTCGKSYVVYPPDREYTGRTGNNCLTVPSNSNIELNGANILCGTNSAVSYSIIHVPTESNNVRIHGGKIWGDRDTHIIPSSTLSNDETHEWCYCIESCGSNVSIEEVEIGGVRGDGINSHSDIEWNHLNPITVFTDVDISNSGVVNDCTYAISSDYYDITPYFTDCDTFILRPSDESGVERVFDNLIRVSYFDESKKFISYEYIRLRDTLNHIPLNAKYLRITIYNPSDEYRNVVHWWCMPSTIRRNLIIHRCKIHECGRNGIVPLSIQNTIISECEIFDIFGTNNHVGIDCEGDSYANANVRITKCRIYRGTKDTSNSVHSSICLPQGYHIEIDDCIVDGISGNAIDVSISRCLIGSDGLNLFNNTVYNILPSRTVTDCEIIGEFRSEDTIFNNCVFHSGSKNTNDRQNAKYYNCKFLFDNINSTQYLTSGYYYDCYVSFLNKTNQSNSVFVKSNHSEIFVFEKCEFHTNGINPDNGNIAHVEFINSKMYLMNDGFNESVYTDKICGCEIYKKGTLAYTLSLKNEKGKQIVFEDNMIHTNSTSSVINLNTKNINVGGIIITGNIVDCEEGDTNFVYGTLTTDSNTIIQNNRFINLKNFVRLVNGTMEGKIYISGNVQLTEGKRLDLPTGDNVIQI